MKKLSNSDLLIYQDSEYRHAANFTQSLYNSPITLNYGAKHDRVKYILSAGTNDNIELLQEGIFIYVIAQNNGLGYISMQIFNTETRGESGEVGDVYLSGEDCTLEGSFSEGILDMDSEAQIKILCEYL